MFTPGGQIDRINRAVFGGGKGGGGGGGQQYVPPAPTVLSDPVSGKTFVQNNDPYSPNNVPGGPSAQQQLNAEIADREAKEKAASDEAANKKFISDTEAKQRFDANKLTAYTDALYGTMRKFQQQGVDPNQYMDLDIKPALNARNNSIQDMDPNPSAAFPSNIGDTIIGDIVSGKRTQANTALNNIFTPTYAEQALPDNLTDQYRDTILNEQFNPLEAQLGNAQKRGMLSDVGYGGAESLLKQKRSAANATLGTLGSNILAADRTGINDYISGARSAVNNLGLADQFDPNVYSTGAQGKVASATGDFGGALRNAVGETKFADISELLNAGGAVQGARNAGDGVLGGAGIGNATSPSAVSEEELAKSKRGLGSTGAF
jgi:hypothetical protein